MSSKFQAMVELAVVTNTKLNIISVNITKLSV